MVSPKRKTAAGSSSQSTATEHVDGGEQLLNKDGTRRKSRVLRRKTDHSIIERRRREKINEKLVALQNIVPACRKECQDFFERKFATPLRPTDDNEASRGAATKRDAKRKRDEERLGKAKSEMSEKIRTNMVLEKLCIISHTLDFVVKLQEENKALRALCDCQAGRRASINSDVELDEHYRSVHSYDSAEETSPRDHIDEKPSLSPPVLSDPDGIVGDEKERPAKRRLHWGSDDVREASIRHDVCRHKHCELSHTEPCRRDSRSSFTEQDIVCDHAVNECKRSTLSPPQEASRPLPPCDSATASDASSCSSFCRTRHSCCRNEELESSEVSSEASDDLTSPPPPPATCQTKWPATAASSHVAYHGRGQRLPPIVNLGLPKHDAPALASLRQDTFASLYRRELPRASDMNASRPFRPLSLYTSHAQASALLGTKP
ncbi:uncharacterized protein SPSC_06256 [Sporisorium scitamineum]|uniref:BHLH domain-containing protein n=1 Tax=Sporisorium scitamineum TaxID=49012 RepID=A0A0F7RUH5_9BASI|nr:hypothetical protein [Sporisorium scitamineum]CDU26089.1 uncharacterized protein SPSC_06256 [Sporisorium scitamineum]